ncbi:MAG TPA: cytochrome c peroxidase [Polyangia bacterium]|nr:cytochrome c peroxidase [Polyangia bacterium]
MERSLGGVVGSLALVLAISGCGAEADDLFCDGAGCGFSDLEWSRLSALANPGPVPPDLSNAAFGDPFANQLGKWFFQDARFSGLATQVDAVGRPAGVTRAPKGQPLNISCASCHDLGRMGVDVASTPGNVSEGAGWTDVNALSVVNSGYSHFYFWNGRADSSWALAFAVAESATTMNGNRLHTAHVVADSYRTQYDAVFGGRGEAVPIPPDQTVCALSALVVQTGPTAGQCSACVPGICRNVMDADGTFAGCYPRFPLDGKPGDGKCHPGDPKEPWGDAYDCMDPADQTAVSRVLANWAKALESYEARLTNVAGTKFDEWIAEGPQSVAIDESARRGAQLFVTKGGCVDCHSGGMLTDNQFHNIGVAQVGPNVPTLADCPAGSAGCDCTSDASTTCLPWGRFTGLARLKAGGKTQRNGLWSDDVDMMGGKDTSRVVEDNATPTQDMKGAWRTPSLRNVAETAPYMHDGRYATLEEVIDHYDRGGDPDPVGTPDIRIRPLSLTDGEKADLAAFLRTLTGPALDPADTTFGPNDPLPPSPVCM